MDYLVRNRRILFSSHSITQAYPGYPLLQWIDPLWAVLPHLQLCTKKREPNVKRNKAECMTSLSFSV